MKWGDCELVYNKENKKISPKHKKGILNYFYFYPEATEENIWHDEETLEYFSAAQVLSNVLSGQNHHFICSRGDFISNQHRPHPASPLYIRDVGYANEESEGRRLVRTCVKYISVTDNTKTSPNVEYGLSPGFIEIQNYYSTLKENFNKNSEMLNTEIRCGYCKEIDEIRNQDSVLIIGGAPSSLQVDYSQFDEIPKWTMNSFYLNDKISSLPNIQLVSLLDNVNIEDNRLWDCLENIKPLLIQEISELGDKRIQDIKNRYDKITYMHTRYRSRLGIGARLIVFAILLGIKKIYITGMDGYDAKLSERHAFEKGKKLPGWLTEFGPHMQKQNFVVFWDYIMYTLKKSYDFEIIDLSKGIDNIQYKFIQEEI